MVFDNQEREKIRFADLISQPPHWSDEYYARGDKQSPLDQIFDAPYFGDSKEVPLLQVADFLTFFLRRHAEIQEGLVAPRYGDEEEEIAGWIAQLAGRPIGRAHIYPKRQRTQAHDLFYRHAPPSVRDP